MYHADQESESKAVWAGSSLFITILHVLDVLAILVSTISLF